MSSRKKYPLEPLLDQRAQRVDERARELLARREEATRAEQHRARAEQRRVEHQLDTVERSTSEVERFEVGEAVAADLMRLHAWHAVRQQEAEALQRQEQAARRDATEAERKEGAARAELAQARAEAKAVEHHRERFDAAERKAEQARWDEEAEDLVAARVRGRSS